jgi:hypothetical protein
MLKVHTEVVESPLDRAGHGHHFERLERSSRFLRKLGPAGRRGSTIRLSGKRKEQKRQ